MRNFLFFSRLPFFSPFFSPFFLPVGVSSAALAPTLPFGGALRSAVAVMVVSSRVLGAARVIGGSLVGQFWTPAVCRSLPAAAGRLESTTTSTRRFRVWARGSLGG